MAKSTKPCLQSIVIRENAFAAMFKRPVIDIDNMTQADADRLFKAIDGQLSPENLFCDGEISREAARQKERTLRGAVQELFNMGFNMPKGCYEI